MNASMCALGVDYLKIRIEDNPYARLDHYFDMVADKIRAVKVSFTRNDYVTTTTIHTRLSQTVTKHFHRFRIAAGRRSSTAWPVSHGRPVSA